MADELNQGAGAGTDTGGQAAPAATDTGGGGSGLQYTPSGDVDFGAIANTEYDIQRLQPHETIRVPPQDQRRAPPAGQAPPAQKLKLGDMEVDQKALTDLLGVFKGDVGKMSEALKNPHKLRGIIESHYTPKLQERAALLEKTAQLEAELQQYRQQRPSPPEPQPRGQQAQPPPAPAVKLDETDEMYGEHNKVINAMYSEVMAAKAEMARMLQAPPHIDEFQGAVLANQASLVQKTYGDDVYRMAAQQVGLQIGRDGKPILSGMKPAEALQRIEGMANFSRLYNETATGDRAAFDAGAGSLPWVKKHAELYDLIDGATFQEVLAKHKETRVYPSPEIITQMSLDKAQWLRKLIEDVNREEAEEALKNRGQPIVSSGAQRTPGQRPAMPGPNYQVPKDAAGDVDFRAMIAEELPPR